MLKRLSNLGEQRVYDEIEGAVAEYPSHIYRKVRIADVINIKSLKDRELRSYALQAHFDFCVCDDQHFPVFAIEYDGAGHDSKNDIKKNEIAIHADLALFRFDERLLNRSTGHMTFIQYLVHTYFLGQEFLYMQESGRLDPTEPFMMSAFLKKDPRNVFDSEFDFTKLARNRIYAIMKRNSAPGGPFYHLNITSIMFGKHGSSFIGFASIPVGTHFVFGRARLDIGTPSLGKLGQLPYGWNALGDYCEAMTLEDLADELETFFSQGAHVLRTRDSVTAEALVLFEQGYRTLCGFAGKDGELFSHIFPPRRD